MDSSGSAISPVSDRIGESVSHPPAHGLDAHFNHARRHSANLPCVLFSQRPDFLIHSATPNIAELTGVPVPEWNRRSGTFWEMVHESDAVQLRQQYAQAVQNKVPATATFRIRHAHTGRVVYILEHRHSTTDDAGALSGYEVVWLDVTRQTIAEKKLSTAAWKESLAVLTLGMAHDFTNVIAGIHSLSESFLLDIQEKHPFFEGLALIKKSSLQASQLVQRMIKLHAGATGEKNFHNLNDIVADVSELIKNIVPRRIQIITDYAPAALPVHLDVVEFRQVVINLVLNGADAMPKGGRLTLRTSRHEAMPVLENCKGMLPRNPCIGLTIEDTGHGIKARHLASIFDPFFTTKAKGSGLGLYNARLSIEKAHGAIGVSSQEGQGTRFQILLPEADLSVSNPVDVFDAPVTARKSLLLVGLPGETFEKTAELLRSHNYYVVTAGPSDSLAELLQSTDYNFNAIFLLAETNDPALKSLPDDIRQQKKDALLVLNLAGCNYDDLDASFLGKIDLLLHSDAAEAESIGRLKSFLDQNN